MRFQPVWVSSIEHIGKVFRLGIEARRHAVRWQEQTPHTNLAGVRVYVTNRNRQYPSKELRQFPHFVHGSFPAFPAAMFSSGLLQEVQGILTFESKPFRLTIGEIARLRQIRFNLPISQIAAVGRFKSSVYFQKRSNINWVRVITSEPIHALPAGMRPFNRLMEKVFNRRPVDDTTLLGSDFLLCVGNGRGDMTTLMRNTDLLFQSLQILYGAHLTILPDAEEAVGTES